MLTAAQPALAPSSLHVLLVGNKEEDFYLIREILERIRSSFAADLDHVQTLEDAKAMLQQKSYGLVLFEHETGDAEAVHFVSEFLHAGVTVPFILLTEEADERTVAEFIDGGTWNCVSKSQLDGATLVRTIRNTMAIHSLQQEQQSVEESLRKLSRAVEQSADTVLVTDRRGVIEYVNPAFEALTGYGREEVRGATPRILKSGEQAPETYQAMWKEDPACRQRLSRHSRKPEKEWRAVLRGGEHLPSARCRGKHYALHCQRARPDGSPAP